MTAFLTYGFRARQPGEDEAMYQAALIAHVDSHDHAAAHELRTGRAQADWTPSDVETFRAQLRRTSPTSDEFSPGIHAFPVLETRPGTHAVTAAAVAELAAQRLAFVVQLRRGDATASLPILATVLLRNGATLSTVVGRGDRIAVLRWLARTQPVYGFVLVFDAFIHQVGDDGRASKRDAILVQLGTRDTRLMQQRPYTVTHGRATFDDPPPPDVDFKQPDAGMNFHDPYAAIFVSVPLSPGAPS